MTQRRQTMTTFGVKKNETNVGGWRPEKPMDIKTSFHYVEGVDTSTDTLTSRDVLGGTATASRSGDKRLPSTRPDRLPAGAPRELPQSTQAEMRGEHLRMNAEKLQAYV